MNNIDATETCPEGYEYNSFSLKGVSAQFDNSQSSPAGCASICAERTGKACTSFAVGTTTEYCYHQETAATHCTGCWTFTDGGEDIDNETQESGVITCIKKASEPCARPASWCKNDGDLYEGTVDCDGDGIADPQCSSTLNVHLQGFIASSNWCGDTWPLKGCGIPPTPAPTPPPTPMPPAAPTPDTCPGGYEYSTYSLKGPSLLMDTSVGSSFPAKCAAICAQRGNCTSFAVGTTTEFCYHTESVDTHCTGCWTYTGGKADLDSKLQEPSLTTCVKKATESCTRPASWCTNDGDTYVDTVDCDDDGIADPQCYNPASNPVPEQGFISSSYWCDDSWPLRGCGMPPTAAPTPPPTPPPTPMPPALATPDTCPPAYEYSTASLKGLSVLMDTSVGSNVPAICATICAQRTNCTSFEVGTTTAHCFHPESADTHCTGCWTYTGGGSDLDSEVQEPSLTTCIKKATESCTRPASWCTNAGDTYVDTVDCDDDGIADPQCFNLANNPIPQQGFIASSNWCGDSWPYQGCRQQAYQGQ